MKTIGVLDRIVDEKHATILAEDIGKEFVLDIKELPEDVLEGDWFDITIENETITNIAINQQITQNKKSSIEDKMARLRKKSGSKFKR